MGHISEPETLAFLIERAPEPCGTDQSLLECAPPIKLTLTRTLQPRTQEPAVNQAVEEFSRRVRVESEVSAH